MHLLALESLKSQVGRKGREDMAPRPGAAVVEDAAVAVVVVLGFPPPRPFWGWAATETARAAVMSSRVSFMLSAEYFVSV